MESKVIIACPPTVHNFPLFAEAHNGVVVLFTSTTEGTVVAIGSSMHSVGYHSTSWFPITDSHWKILPKGSTVTLTQE